MNCAVWPTAVVPSAPRVQVTVSETIDVTRTAQSITLAPAPPDSLGVGGSAPVAATASSGLPVTLSTTGPCTLDNGTLTTVGGGEGSNVSAAVAQPDVDRVELLVLYYEKTIVIK